MVAGCREGDMEWFAKCAEGAWRAHRGSQRVCEVWNGC